MTEIKDTIDRALQEHHNIRDTVELDGGPVSDFEALFALRQAYAGWSQCTPDEVTVKRGQLLQTLDLVDRGLRLHWGFEEKAMQPIFGGPLMKAFLAEHHDIGALLKNACEVIAAEKLDGLAPEELLAKKTAIQEIINRLMQAIEEHSNHEDMLFKMIKRGQEAEP
jgi:hemerythrin